MKKTIFTMAAMLVISLGAFAQAGNENRNLKGEKKRVAQGIKNGEITKGEVKVIKAQAQDVKQAVQTAKADGIVTKREKVHIAKQDAQLDRKIRRAKHNKRDRH